MTTPEETITINEKNYNINDLSDDAKAQLISLRTCEQELNRLKSQIAITETAKMAYSHALIQAVESDSDATL